MVGSGARDAKIFIQLPDIGTISVDYEILITSCLRSGSLAQYKTDRIRMKGYNKLHTTLRSQCAVALIFPGDLTGGIGGGG
jgi:hypothetical protein